MKKEIILQKGKIAYAFYKRKRASKICLSICGNGSVVITSPFNLKKEAIKKLVAEKENWLLSGILRRKSNYRKYLENKEKARTLIKERIDYFNKIYGYDFNKIAVKNQRTLWGSCSCKGNLNFNYKILFLPERVRDYVIVHELCHLKELNHSRRFWNLVSLVFPDYREKKKELSGFRINI